MKEILLKRHPKAQVYALYRSAVAIEFDEQQRLIHIFTCGDPHVWGQEICDKNIEESEYIITGNRFAPFLFSGNV